ncbi:nucleotidyltransferase [Halobacteriales archaeon QS_8_69_26]|nr:MAG: nucleotidyltransferase [Halobacteriales archaeon QS_8_69_26]
MGIDGTSDDRDEGKAGTTGSTVRIPVPAKNGDLYRHSVTDDLLSFLLDRPFDEYTIRKLASVLGTTHRTVGTTVDILEDNDLVVVTPEGNKKLVSINRDRVDTPEDDVLRIPQSEFQPPVREAVDAIVEELEDVLGVLVFGSVARGEADRRSDVDLWVLVREDRMRNQRRTNEVATELGETKIAGDRYDFHVVVETPGSVPAHTEDIADIVTEGIPVHRTEEFEQFRSLMEGMVDER